jgi:glyoxylase-like metal-dependent hydrolase (beta-lactamase superfamily II)/8-oxo-dGTP pyrophosphatase MutT (NUDIX family)
MQLDITVPEPPLSVRQAATLMLLRDGAAGLEVLLLRRAEQAGDMRGGVWVFPGGVLDAADAALQGRAGGLDDVAASARLGLGQGGLDYYVAAIRECFEEAGVLLGVAAPAHAAAPVLLPAGVRTALAAVDRTQLGAAGFAALCETLGLRLSAGALVAHSHWMTPPGIAKRFDTRFFVAAVPPGQVPVPDGREVLECAWSTPQAALAAPQRFKLLPVTRRSLEALAGFASVAACLDAARAKEAQGPLQRQLPRLARDARGFRAVLPGEWAFAEIGLLDPDALGQAWCDLLPGRAVRLTARVWRVTAGNGSMMTGPGTNTYLLRDPSGGAWTVLDPGPADEAHVQAVSAALQQIDVGLVGDLPSAALPAGLDKAQLETAGSDTPASATSMPETASVARIVVTHTHRDHSPGAARWHTLTGAHRVGSVALYPDGQDDSFQPEQPVHDGDRLHLGPETTLRAVATPGHASNHFCWLLEEERLLFTGDHVMQGSTVVINPPDGNMTHYLDALQRLLGLDIDWLAPGHGFLIDAPHAEVRKLIAHRLRREARVAAALQEATRAAGSVTVLQLLPAVYDDVPPARHGIAARSLLAHLLKLQADGLARQDAAGEWTWVASEPAPQPR